MERYAKYIALDLSSCPKPEGGRKHDLIDDIGAENAFLSDKRNSEDRDVSRRHKASLDQINQTWSNHIQQVWGNFEQNYERVLSKLICWVYKCLLWEDNQMIIGAWDLKRIADQGRCSVSVQQTFLTLLLCCNADQDQL